MRPLQARWYRTVQLLLLAVALMIAGAACAGKESPAASNAANAAPPDVNVSDDSGSDNAEAAAQAATPTVDPVLATVNSTPILVAEFETERNRRAMGMTIEPATADAFDQSVLQSMIDQVLIEQYAAQQGIEVTDEDVDAELAIQEQIAQQNDQTLEDLVAAQMYTVDEYREAIRDMLLWTRVSEAVTADVSPMATQVHARHILVADEATARAIIDQLNQGADFAQLALQYSLDSSTAASGGDLSWVSIGDLLQPEVENAIFALPAGTLSQEPVHSSLGYHVVQTLEVVEDRPLDQASLARKKEQTFLNWLDAQRSAAIIEEHISSAGG
ncbi:MAG TPA: peptidylprolyl isomerase [Aggregatilinea sp.]|uniref:peptidylprolyl isomerase n=1 Tax=Aggregatilinea sp. TaxID=2806333 RepID=UPI002C499E43|nr:peptidylprolyl isomerase [Aggregatilinea sp.]HML23586.1 peptidylprolyl isomerase [Aggregatilinea sp.]